MGCAVTALRFLTGVRSGERWGASRVPAV